MSEEPKIPEAIAKHKKLYDKGKILQDTITRSHRTAYTAAEEILLDENGNLDVKKLDDVKFQDKFIKTLLDSYQKDAKKALGSDKNDEHINNLVMNAYHGVTSEFITEQIRENGSKYDFEQHYGLMDQVMKKKVIPNIQGTAKAHLKKTDIEDILKYTNTHKSFDASKMQIKQAIGILEKYHDKGVITIKDHEKELYFKKPSGK